jgi:hypothetical protein
MASMKIEGEVSASSMDNFSTLISNIKDVVKKIKGNKRYAVANSLMKVVISLFCDAMVFNRVAYSTVSSLLQDMVRNVDSALTPTGTTPYELWLSRKEDYILTHPGEYVVILSDGTEGVFQL